MEKETEVFNALVHGAKTHNSQGWTRSKPAARNSSQVSHVVAGHKHLGFLLLLSQVHWEEAGTKRRHLGFELALLDEMPTRKAAA